MPTRLSSAINGEMESKQIDYNIYQAGLMIAFAAEGGDEKGTAAMKEVTSGFVEGKGQPGFFPAGPWMVRGSELFADVERCGAEGLGLRLWVDEEGEPRQDATTELMILKPWELVGRIGSWIEEHGRRTPMPFVRPAESEPPFYPFAVPEEAPRLPAGSIIQPAPPEGVAMRAPSALRSPSIAFLPWEWRFFFFM